MRTSQTHAFKVQLAGSAPRLFGTARGRRTRRISSHASTLLNSGRVINPLDMSKEWYVVQQAIAGNADAHQHLFTAHADRLYRTAFAVLRDKEDAEDAVQDGLCNAYTHLRVFQGRSSFSTWLTRIVINAALMIRRRKNTHPEISLDEILDGQAERLPRVAVDPQPNPEEIYYATEINTLVEGHVRQLRPALQGAYRLRAINGLSAAESSQALGIPANAVKSRMFRARRILAHGLQQSLATSASA